MFARYTGLGAVSLFLNIAITSVLHERIGLSEEISYACSVSAVFLMNFVLARKFVYKSKGRLVGEFAGFLSTALGFRVVEYILFIILNTVVGIYYITSILLVAIMSFITKYFAYKFFVFDERREMEKEFW